MASTIGQLTAATIDQINLPAEVELEIPDPGGASSRKATVEDILKALGIRVTDSSLSGITPSDGMIVYVTDASNPQGGTGMLFVREDSAWNSVYDGGNL